MKDKIFFDSNIFLYAFNKSDIKKQSVANKVIMNDGYVYFISTQVINEVSNNMLKKLAFKNYEVKEFISEDMQHEQLFDSTKIINPFKDKK
ncbi:MAG: hypothetical protein GQ570_11965 [Helicobacteraceae bacterium]|nr:hypothetical protein [Helicobacteraceae bacterium]